MLFARGAQGKLALVDEPAIGLFDVALAKPWGFCGSKISQHESADIGALFKFLKDKRKEASFALLAHGRASRQIVREGEVVIQSMWSPAYNELGSAGAIVKEAVPAGAIGPGMADSA